MAALQSIEIIMRLLPSRCGGHEGAEELFRRTIIGCLFRVPLHGDEERTLPAFKGFDNTIAGKSRELDAAAGIFDALVVAAAYSYARRTEDFL